MHSPPPSGLQAASGGSGLRDPGADGALGPGVSQEAGSSGPDSRAGSAARRRVRALGKRLDQLQGALDAAAAGGAVTAAEANRRGGDLKQLRARQEALLQALRAAPTQRDGGVQLPGLGADDLASPRPVVTGSVDEVLGSQQQQMAEQDQALEDLSNITKSTKHIALAISDELDLHERLLDDLEDSVEHTTSRMQFAKKKLTQFMKKSKICGFLTAFFVLLAVLVVVGVVAFRRH